MKAFAFALLLIAATGIADDQPPAKPDARQQQDIFHMPAPPKPASSRYFICPKDETVVRVGRLSPKGELLCPVDGTKMKAGTGPSKSIYLLR